MVVTPRSSLNQCERISVVRHRRLFLAILSVFVLSWSSVGFTVEREVGALDLSGVPVTYKSLEKWQGLRMESFGDTQIQIIVEGHGLTRPQFLVEGPLENWGDSVELETGPIIYTYLNSDGVSSIATTVSLPAAGVYRLGFRSDPLAGSSSSAALRPFLGTLSEDALSIRAECRENCVRPSIAFTDLYMREKATGHH